MQISEYLNTDSQNTKKAVSASDPNSLSVFSKDPDASYDVNDGDPDPQPRYTQLNDNR